MVTSPSRAHWLRLLADIVFSPGCEVCDRSLPAGTPDVLCAHCLGTILPPPGPLCPHCGLPTSVAAACATCARRPPAFRSARALALYRPAEDPQNPLTRAIQLLKYGRRRPIAATLGRLLAERYPFTSAATIVPVPLHPSRLRRRGFNQAALLAAHLGRGQHLPVLLRALVKRRPTPAQAALRAVDRWRNLDETFIVRDPRVVEGRRIVLVDDVLTTGATADACAVALSAAGAATVDVFTVARAP